MQDKIMISDPQTGGVRPYPSHAEQYRKYHGRAAWLFNPWTGTKRNTLDIGSDVLGYGIVVPDEQGE